MVPGGLLRRLPGGGLLAAERLSRAGDDVVARVALSPDGDGRPHVVGRASSAASTAVAHSAASGSPPGTISGHPVPAVPAAGPAAAGRRALDRPGDLLDRAVARRVALARD